MADVIPQTAFHVTFSEKEYNLVMLALALVAGAEIKPDGHHKRAAAELNRQLLQVEQRIWRERSGIIEKKIKRAPAISEVENI